VSGVVHLLSKIVYATIRCTPKIDITFAGKTILKQNYIKMEVITIESGAFKYFKDKLCTIEQAILYLQNKIEGEPEDSWVDNYEVCTFLKVSSKTLQRLRSANTVSYSRIGGKIFYRISEIQRLLNENIIQRNDEHLQDLIKNHQLYVEQKRAIRTNK